MFSIGGNFDPPPKEHLRMSKDTFSCHNWGTCSWHPVGGSRHAAPRPTTQPAPDDKDSSSTSVTVQVENPVLLYICTYAHMHQNGIHLLLMDIHTFNFSSLQIGLWSLSCCELHGVGSRVSETRKLSFFTPRGLHPAARRPSPHHETNIALRHTIALWISCGLP